ncbi:MAG: hypothetical protein KGL39_28520 [Patescibacteria group bacterium]|nr:hypothetical protein [Patescibacteria group bacterium]
MSTPVYSFALITPPPPGLLLGETAIKITQSGSSENLHVAARIACSSGSDGNPVVTAFVRVILPTGAPALDANGVPCSTQFGVSATPALITQCTNLAELQKCVLMTALGGDSGALAVSASVAANASIINRALARLALQPVSVASLL